MLRVSNWCPSAQHCLIQLEGKNVKELLSNVGAGGAPYRTCSLICSWGNAGVEEKKEEKEEEKSQAWIWCVRCSWI